MSGPQAPQLDLIYPPNLVPPTFYTNVVQLGVVGDEEFCLNFAIRSPEKPMLQANLQCRVITSVASLRRLAQGLTSVLAQYDQQRAQAQQNAQAQAEMMQLAKDMTGKNTRPGAGK
jgi:hypothetical protein